MTTQPQSATTAVRQPAFFIPHGGGPCFFMEWPGKPGMWDPMAGFLGGIRDTLATPPRAIVVISAHWEAARATVTTAEHPTLIYDYAGFPPHTYDLEYAAAGAPAVAARIRELLAGHGVESAADDRRGFDHGVFVPFKLIEPEAAIPIVALSLVDGLDPAVHLAIGRALEPLRDEGILIVGSGMSYHNLGAFMSRMRDGQPAPGSREFDDWLSATVGADATSRADRLRHWAHAPGARLAHPREEHLLPLMVAAGAAGSDSGTRVFHDRLGGSDISGYRFG
jgi:aromatic ring-opening dioxygenase catalytic subunit (LigB family)